LTKPDFSAHANAILTSGKPFLAMINHQAFSSEDRLAALEGVLARQELSYLRQLRHSTTRQQYLAGRAVLRILLFSLTNVPPPGALFRDGISGPPVGVTCDDGNNLMFNVSHARPLTLFGFCKGRQLGVDIEAVRPVRHLLHLAEYAFSSEECKWIAGLNPDTAQSAFIRLWTRKEAVVKYYGLTVSRDMGRFTVPLESAPGMFSISPRLRCDSADLGLIDFELKNGTYGALCWNGPLEHVEVHEIRPIHIERLLCDYS